MSSPFPPPDESDVQPSDAQPSDARPSDARSADATPANRTTPSDTPPIAIPHAAHAHHAPRVISITPREAPPSEASRRARLGVAVGLIAAAATIGAIVGFGLRSGASLRPFTSIGRQALALEAAHTGVLRALATTVGLGLHVLAVVAWSVLFALAAARWTGWRRWAAAAVTAGVAFAADRVVLPEVWRVVDVPAVSALQRAAVYVVLSLALALGMRVAHHDSRPA